jgi:hypothetical protein
VRCASNVEKPQNEMTGSGCATADEPDCSTTDAVNVGRSGEGAGDENETCYATARRDERLSVEKNLEGKAKKDVRCDEGRG